MKKLILSLAMLSTVFVACSDDDESASDGDNNVSEAAVISGGPYTFIAGDGIADIVDDVVVVDAGVGTYNTFVITDAENNVLGLPPTVADFPDFDGAGNGVCLIWHLNYEGDPDTFFDGVENASDLSGDFALSNSLMVNRNGAVAAVLEGGPYTFIAGDGVEDIVDDVVVADAGVGTYNTFVITDADGNVLGLPPTVADFPDFDGAGEGVCLIWHLNYEGDPDTFFDGVENASDLSGAFALSNSLTVNRVAAAVAPVISGGPFTFTAGDGNMDNVSGISVTDEGVGESATWVITDADGNILGLPPTLADVEANDFDGAGVGVCLIWYLRFTGDLENATPMVNNASEIIGNFALSNSIEVNRVAAAM